MITPRKVKFEAKKKENENIEFRTFLKCNADVGTVVRCTAEVFQKKIWRKMQNI